MENLFGFLLLASLILLVIGFFKPSASLFWDKKHPTRKKSGLVYGGLLLFSFIMFGVTSDKIKAENSSPSKQTASSNSPVQNEEPKIIEQTQAQKDSIAQAEHDAELAEIKKNTITASNLTAQYEANEVAADNNFKDKTFYVSGTVTDIKKDIMGDIYVVLKGNEMFRDVQCFFEDSDVASQLQKGMKVTFKGKCDGLMMNVLMRDCVLAQ